MPSVTDAPNDHSTAKRERTPPASSVHGAGSQRQSDVQGHPAGHVTERCERYSLSPPKVPKLMRTCHEHWD